ncbi:6549_t:CDS:10, partial [Acaulospora morrowiae]
MSSNVFHDYFKRKSADWYLIGFLNESEEEPFQLKVDLYLRSLRWIINYEEGIRKEKAQLLYNKYNSKEIEPQTSARAQDTEPDYKKARKWEAGRSKKHIYLNKPTFMDIGSASGIVNSGTINGTINSEITGCGAFDVKCLKKSSKRENDHEKLQSKRIKKNENVADPLPDDQIHMKIHLVESHQNHISTPDISTTFNCEEDVDIESEYCDARKRYKILCSWGDVIDKIDFRDTSKEDWIVERYNLSDEFRKFQQLTIRQIKENPYLCYKQNIKEILCLSNIMHIERTKPSYLTVTSTIWNKIFQRQLPSSLPPVVSNVALEYTSMLNSFKLLSDIQDVWCANFSKVVELSIQEKEKFCQAQIIFRNFLLLSSKGVDTNNENTFVHETLHDLFKEIFHDSMFELIWVNGESSVSKNRRSSDKENSRGKKPDFKILTNTRDEIIFSEAKPKDLSSILINKDFIKLSDFQVNALDELVKRYGNRIGLASFGARIRIYEMDINYDGIYRMFLIANVLTPTEQAQFLNLISVLEALYNVKDRISEVLKVIASSTPPSPLRSTYCGMSIPLPKPVKVAII